MLKEYLLRGAVRTVLVLVPASLCEQWRAELWEKFELDFVVSRGPAPAWGRHPLVISSLETARHERHRRRVRGPTTTCVVVDEAHRLRNHLTLGWKFINDLNPRYLLLLTATPVQNDMRELYNLATLVRPGTFQFRRDFRRRDMVRTPAASQPRPSCATCSSVMIRNARRSETKCRRAGSRPCGSRSVAERELATGSWTTGVRRRPRGAGSFTSGAARPADRRRLGSQAAAARSHASRSHGARRDLGSGEALAPANPDGLDAGHVLAARYRALPRAPRWPPCSNWRTPALARRASSSPSSARPRTRSSGLREIAASPPSSTASWAGARRKKRSSASAPRCRCW